jgi:type IX secretion system substrate protein
LGVYYEIFETTIVNSITTFVWDNDQQEQIAQIEAGNYSLIGRIYEYDLDLDEASTSPIISTELYTLTFNDTMDFITLDFIKDGEAEVLEPGSYVASLEFFTGNPDYRFEIASDDRVLPPYPAFLGLFSGEWGWLGNNNPVININVGITTETYDVTFNVDMNGPITEGTFVVGTDVVNVTGNFSEWSEPGSDASLTLTDTDADGIYTVTYSGFTGGELQYKYFQNSGWDGGEWTGDPNRTIDVTADVTFDDVWAVYDDAVGNLDITKLSIYPNPANNTLNIDNMVGVERIVISNIIGQEVVNISNVDNNISINTSYLDSGMYIVTFIDANNNAQSTRVVKK